MMGMSSIYAQYKYVTQVGNISFYSSTPSYEIKGISNEAFASLNIQNGEFIVTVAIQSFHFEQPDVEKNFCSTVLESKLYPTASFKGKVKGFTAIDFNKNGSYSIEVTGMLTLHGVSRSIQLKGNLEVINGTIEMNSNFLIKPNDYNIKITEEHKEQVAEKVEVIVDLQLLTHQK